MRRAGGRRGARAPRVSGGRLGPRRRWLPAAGGSAPRRAPHFFFPRRFAQSGSPHFPDPRAPGQREASRIARARAQTTGARAVEKRDVSLLVCTHVRAVCARVCVERDASLFVCARARKVCTRVLGKRDASLLICARALDVCTRVRDKRDVSLLVCARVREICTRIRGKRDRPIFAESRGFCPQNARFSPFGHENGQFRLRLLLPARHAVAQVSKPAVSRVSKPADRMISSSLPTWKSAIQQVWKPALRWWCPDTPAARALTVFGFPARSRPAMFRVPAWLMPGLKN